MGNSSSSPTSSRSPSRSSSRSSSPAPSRSSSRTRSSSPSLYRRYLRRFESDDEEENKERFDKHKDQKKDIMNFGGKKGSGRIHRNGQTIAWAADERGRAIAYHDGEDYVLQTDRDGIAGVKDGDVYATTQTRDSRKPTGRIRPRLLPLESRCPLGHDCGPNTFQDPRCPYWRSQSNIGSDLVLSSATDYVNSTFGRGTSVTTGNTAFTASGIYKIGEGTGSEGSAFAASGKYARKARAGRRVKAIRYT